jgi:anhydro-N-acetylmuramic acid kinase
MDLREPASPKITAFDTGPANMLIDLAVRELTGGKRSYDRDGALGRMGQIDSPALDRWLRHPYFRKAPPKSTGRELFGAEFLARCREDLRAENLVATLTEFTACSIALNYRLHLPRIPERVILCGGGAENPFLAERIAVALRQLLEDVEIVNSRELGWAPQVIEGAAFALLAWLRWHDLPGNIPETTGASRACLLGQVTLP